MCFYILLIVVFLSIVRGIWISRDKFLLKAPVKFIKNEHNKYFVLKRVGFFNTWKYITISGNIYSHDSWESFECCEFDSLEQAINVYNGYLNKRKNAIKNKTFENVDIEAYSIINKINEDNVKRIMKECNDILQRREK